MFLRSPSPLIVHFSETFINSLTRLVSAHPFSIIFLSLCFIQIALGSRSGSLYSASGDLQLAISRLATTTLSSIFVGPSVVTFLHKMVTVEQSVIRRPRTCCSSMTPRLFIFWVKHAVEVSSQAKHIDCIRRLWIAIRDIHPRADEYRTSTVATMPSSFHADSSLAKTLRSPFEMTWMHERFSPEQHTLPCIPSFASPIQIVEKANRAQLTIVNEQSKLSIADLEPLYARPLISRARKPTFVAAISYREDQSEELVDKFFSIIEASAQNDKDRSLWSSVHAIDVEM
ncbi:hypothetical protein DL96DRAFT_1112343 [Flagelloscypha sp. PMI_526]|nr:hypothetical protein DL96DRAFT_1112343 [Flagelloscypha sp. PMI_526]